MNCVDPPSHGCADWMSIAVDAWIWPLVKLDRDASEFPCTVLLFLLHLTRLDPLPRIVSASQVASSTDM